MKLGTEVGLGPGHIVLDGNPALPPQKGHRTQPPKFFAHVCCRQTAGWIEMPLATEVGLSPDDILLDGDPASSQKGAHPQFWSMSTVAKGFDGSR